MSTTTQSAAVGTKKRPSIGAMLLEGRAFFALLLVIIVFSILSPNYFTANNLITMTSHVAVYALLAIGMLLVILNGGIDLSVGSTLGLSGVFAGFLMQGVKVPALGHAFYPNVLAVVLICCLLGALVGWVNGTLISRFKVAPFVATLGTLYVVRGAALLMTNGLTYNDLGGNPAVGNTGFDWLGFNTILGLPVGVVVMIIVAALASLMLNRSIVGRWMYAAGGNERAAELSGVPVRRVKIWVYVISGVCSALAGLILSSQLTSAGPTAGNSYELTAIAAVVIGGAALTGGRGNIRGTLLGAFVIGFLSDGLVIIGVSAYWQTVFMGAVIVLAVLLNSIQYGKRTRPTKTTKPAAPATSAEGSAPAAASEAGTASDTISVTTSDPRP